MRIITALLIAMITLVGFADCEARDCESCIQNLKKRIEASQGKKASITEKISIKNEVFSCLEVNDCPDSYRKEALAIIFVKLHVIFDDFSKVWK